MEINEFRQLAGLSKRLCPIVTGIFEEEKIIVTKTSGIKIQMYITKKGKDLIHAGIS